MAAFTVTHGTPADGTFSGAGATAWDAEHDFVILGTSGGIPYFSANDAIASSAALAANGVVIGGGAGVAPVTSTLLTFDESTKRLAVGTGNGTSSGVVLGYLGTGSGAGALWSTAESSRTNQTANLYINTSQTVINAPNSGTIYHIINDATIKMQQVATAGVGPAFAEPTMNFGSLTFGGARTRSDIAKAVTAFSDAVAKAVLTFTVPNAAHSASFLIRIVGSLGAGGAIGANEATQTATYQVDITRTAGVNAIATISAVYTQAASATVAGGQNIATTAALSAIAGAADATNTFTVNATLTRAGAGATNHTALVHASLLNANATGVTVA